MILRYSPNVNIWLILQFWYPQVDSLVLLIDVEKQCPCINVQCGPMVVMTREEMQVGAAHAASQEAYSLMRKGEPNLYTILCLLPMYMF